MNDRKATDLLHAAKCVHDMLVSGHQPARRQLQRLGNAIAACERMMRCGHLEDEKCDCENRFYRLTPVSRAARRHGDGAGQEANVRAEEFYARTRGATSRRTGSPRTPQRGKVR